jgi:hypothetical protein
MSKTRRMLSAGRARMKKTKTLLRVNNTKMEMIGRTMTTHRTNRKNRKNRNGRMKRNRQKRHQQKRK